MSFLLKFSYALFLSLSLSSSLSWAALSISEMEGNIKGSRTKQILQDRISREKAEAEKSVKPIAEAVVALQSVNNALKALESKDMDLCKAELATASAKLEVVADEHGDLKLVPISSVVRVLDTTANEDVLKDRAQEIKNLVRSNDLQAAKPLLVEFASEINIEATYLPRRNFTKAVQDAQSFIGEGKLLEARAELMAALNTVAVSQNVLPLPVIKAQTFIDEVNRQIADKKVDKDQADRFLTGAQEQLDQAEILGYRNSKKDFASMRLTINQLKKSIHQEKESKGLMSRLLDDLKSFMR